MSFLLILCRRADAGGVALAWPLPVFERIGVCGEKFLKLVHLFSTTFHDAGGQLVGCLYDRYQRV